MKVVRSDAVKLMQGLGWAKADGWNKRRMMRTIKNDLPGLDGTEVDPDIIEDQAECKRLNGLLLEIRAADGDIDVVASDDDLNTPDDTTPEPVKEDPVVEEPKAEKPKVRRGKAAKAKEAKAAKAKVEKDNKLPKKKTRGESGPDVNGNPEGINSIRNRLFYAGVVLREAGLEGGLSDTLIEELDRVCGKPNLRASKGQLGYAWHVINGYRNG